MTWNTAGREGDTYWQHYCFSKEDLVTSLVGGGVLGGFCLDRVKTTLGDKLICSTLMVGNSQPKHSLSGNNIQDNAI